MPDSSGVYDMGQFSMRWRNCYMSGKYYDGSDERQKTDIKKVSDETIERYRKVDFYEYRKDGVFEVGIITQKAYPHTPEVIAVPEKEEDLQSADYIHFLCAKCAGYEQDIKELRGLIEKLNQKE